MSGLDEHVRDPLLSPARHREQVSRHLVGRRACVAERLGRMRVHQLTLGRGQLVVDGVADERVHEAERRLVAEDLRAGERRGLSRHLLLGKLGQGGDGGEVGALAEHGDCARHTHGLFRKPREPDEDGPRNGARADVRHHLDARGVGRDAVGLERREQLAQQQRVAARHAGARGAEALVGVLPEPGAHHRGDGIGAERAGADGARGGLGADLGDQRGVRAGVGAPERRADQDRHVLEPSCEVGEEPERWTVAPVQVVHRQEDRPIRRGVGREPVEAVESGERRVRRDGGRVENGCTEDRLSGGGGPGQPARPDLLVAQGRLEQLAHDPERELPLELAAARGEHPEALLLGRRPELGEEPALPDAGGALDQREPALAIDGLGQRGAQRLELAIALEEQLCPSGVRHAAHPRSGPRFRPTAALRGWLGRVWRRKLGLTPRFSAHTIV